MVVGRQPGRPMGLAVRAMTGTLPLFYLTAIRRAASTCPGPWPAAPATVFLAAVGAVGMMPLDSTGTKIVSVRIWLSLMDGL